MGRYSEGHCPGYENMRRAEQKVREYALSTCLDDKHTNTGILGEAIGNYIASSTTTDNNEIIVRVGNLVWGGEDGR